MFLFLLDLHRKRHQSKKVSNSTNCEKMHIFPQNVKKKKKAILSLEYYNRVNIPVLLRL